ncbi:TetR/AcrR family transcriptional regulator [Silvimonas amylolytica]|uniref:TetR family transcriptional regulator n=1 Tax=Silvimonas amylolytica TaxID=449663 RepID=A0ABQ2PHQ9_9NEIS|nr:TetR/AcrR family transcriptional regulator [Silvimonas amylolytica]GGP24843.1 TetR family transcriptional regulator [Silvimonas amylolytica]
MDNVTRSEQSRLKAIKAAHAILTRDGVGALTFDALAAESGLSKGGLLHQFATKEELLNALLEHRQQFITETVSGYNADAQTAVPEPLLHGHLAALQGLSGGEHKAVNLALLAALVQAPELLHQVSADHVESLAQIRDEAVDADLASLRWLAASGLLFMDLLGWVPLSEEDGKALFDRLNDTAAWHPAKDL